MAACSADRVLESEGGCAAAVRVQEVDRFLLQQPVSALPGVGWSSRGRLEEMGIETVAQLRLASPAALQTAFGAKTAQELLRFANGQDDRQVRPPRCRVTRSTSRMPLQMMDNPRNASILSRTHTF